MFQMQSKRAHKMSCQEESKFRKANRAKRDNTASALNLYLLLKNIKSVYPYTYLIHGQGCRITFATGKVFFRLTSTFFFVFIIILVYKICVKTITQFLLVMSRLYTIA